MIVGGHSTRMIPVLPESTFSAFTAIEFLSCFSGDQLNRFRNRFIPESTASHFSRLSNLRKTFQMASDNRFKE
jgi:hypothetical protein